MKSGHFRTVRFLLWYSAVTMSLLFIYVLLVLVFFADNERVVSQNNWNLIVPMHLAFSMVYSTYLEWFSGFFRTKQGRP